MTHTTSSGIFSIRYAPRLCFVRMCLQAIPALPFQSSYWALARRRHAESENAPHSPRVGNSYSSIVCIFRHTLI